MVLRPAPHPAESSFDVHGLAAGLLLMVLTSCYVWWQLRRKRLLGLAALVAGALSCGFFVVGLTWLG